MPEAFRLRDGSWQFGSHNKSLIVEREKRGGGSAEPAEVYSKFLQDCMTIIGIASSLSDDANFYFHF